MVNIANINVWRKNIEGPRWREIDYSETLIFKIIKFFSSCRAMAELSRRVLSKSLASTDKTVTQLISNRILEIRVSQ
jgi:hypothetical protein